MSTWISKAGAALVALAGLTACVVDNIATPGPVATRSVLVSQGAVVITGPTGYCVDKSASKNESLVLFGTCAAITGSAFAGKPDAPAILTASVLPGSSDAEQMSQNFPAMARLLRSEPGRAALSRSGRSGDVDVSEVISVGNVLYIRLSDRSTLAGQAVEPEYWRAVLPLKGHIVTLSALGLRDRPLQGQVKRRVLESFVAGMQAANR